MKSRKKILNQILLVDFKSSIDDYYDQLHYYDYDDDDFYDYSDDDDYYRDSDKDIKIEYISKLGRFPHVSKKTLVLGRKVDLNSYYSASILRDKKIECILEGKPFTDKNYLDNFLSEKSRSVLDNWIKN
jgi:hypothetical protein